MHVLHVIRIGGVLDDHLRVHLDPVDHPGVRVQRVVLVGLQFGQHRGLPVRRAAVTLVPHQDEAVPLRAGVRADADVLLAADLAVRDQRIRAVAVPAPAVPRADDPLTLDGAADSHVRPEVLAVGVEHVELPGLGAEDHQFLAEVVGPFHLARGQLGGESDDEPARREPIRREADAAWPEFTLRRIVWCPQPSPPLLSPSARTTGQVTTCPLPIFTILGILGQGHESRSATDEDGGCPRRFRSTCQILRCGRTVFPTICSPSCAASGRSFTTS